MINVSTTHVVIDGLQINNWSREVLLEQHAGGVTGVSATCAVWEDTIETIRNITAWYELAAVNSDLVTLAGSADDLRTAGQEGRVGVLLNFQNTSPFGDDLGMVEVFHRLGVRVAQLTYNIQNLVGGACYDKTDNGLTPFGRNVIGEMNRVGMLVDVSHVGNKTALDAVGASTRPIAITHANPLWFYDNPRNKPDDVIEAVTTSGGVIGCCLYPRVIGDRTTREQFCTMMARLAEQVGVEHVAIGSDTTRGWTDDYLVFLRNGRYRRSVPDDPAPSWPSWPSWFQGPADYPNLIEGLIEVGFGDEELAAVLGGNWLHLFDEVLTPAAGP